MQQRIDLLLFLVSNAILVYWCVLVFRNDGKKTLGLRLPRKKIVTLVIIELVLFFAMYINYEMFKSPEIADSFAWHNLIVYARGVLPLAALAAVNDDFLSFEASAIATLPIALMVDYIVLWICTKITDFINVRESKAHSHLDL